MRSIASDAQPRCAQPDGPDTLDVDRAEAFLRVQGAALAAAVSRAGDPGAVAAALAEHEASHPGWIDLIATVGRRLGDAPASDVAAVYACHGQAVGLLESRLHRLVAPAACDLLQASLGLQLQELTDRAVAAILTGRPQPVPAAAQPPPACA